jgi:tripeptidyl-peptidase-1
VHVDEVAAHLQPSQESFEAFNAFASTNGLQTTVGAGHGEWMTFTTNVSHANSLFAASFQHFQHQTAAEPILRTLSYSLPSALADHVGAVFPMTSFNAPPARTRAPAIPRTYARRQVPSSAQFDSTNITPACLQTMYNIPASASNASGVSILVTGYLNASPQNADIEVSPRLILYRAC